MHRTRIALCTPTRDDDDEPCWLNAPLALVIAVTDPISYIYFMVHLTPSTLQNNRLSKSGESAATYFYFFI